MQRQGDWIVLSVSSRLQSVSFHWLQWQGRRPQTTLVWTKSNPIKVSGRFWSACGNKLTLAFWDQTRKWQAAQQVLIDRNCLHLQRYKWGTNLVKLLAGFALRLLCRGFFSATIIHFAEALLNCSHQLKRLTKYFYLHCGQCSAYQHEKPEDLFIFISEKVLYFLYNKRICCTP